MSNYPDRIRVKTIYVTSWSNDHDADDWYVVVKSARNDEYHFPVKSTYSQALTLLYRVRVKGEINPDLWLCFPSDDPELDRYESGAYA